VYAWHAAESSIREHTVEAHLYAFFVSKNGRGFSEKKHRAAFLLDSTLLYRGEPCVVATLAARCSFFNLAGYLPPCVREGGKPPHSGFLVLAPRPSGVPLKKKNRVGSLFCSAGCISLLLVVCA
jgi:hypothetical protein